MAYTQQTITVSPTSQGGYDSYGYHYPASTAAITAWSGDANEIEYAIFNISDIENIVNGLTAAYGTPPTLTLSFTTSTSDVIQHDIYTSFGYFASKKDQINAESGKSAVTAGTISGDDAPVNWAALADANNFVTFTTDSQHISSSDTVYDITSDMNEAFGYGRDVVVTGYEHEGGFSQLINPRITISYLIATGMPTISGTTSNQTVIAGRSITPFSQVNLSNDGQGGTQDQIAITILDSNGQATGTAGTLSAAPGVTLNDFGDGNYQIGPSTDLASLQASLDSLTFTAASGAAGHHVTFEIDLQSGAGGATDNKYTTVNIEPACYCTGTLIRTARGDVSIETLMAGDLIVTASGARRPVRWIGRRHLDLSCHPDPTTVWPVRVASGALGKNLPARDLWLSPGHCVFVEGVLIPIRSLVNNASVAQVPMAETTYWHVELDRHDVILAEGLPAETYLDTGNRAAFENGGAPVTPYPDFALCADEVPAAKCAPVRNGGPEVQAARRTLAEHIDADAFPTTSRHDLHIVADGRRINAMKLGGKRMAFVLPAATGSVKLTSRTFIPWHTDSRSSDARVLGAFVKRLQVDGNEVDLGGDSLGAGWHRPERKPERVQRWTNGSAELPSGARLVIVDLAGDGRYWIARRDNVVALRA